MTTLANNIKTYHTLFARTSSGKIQTWYMELNEEDGSYRTVSGQEDGKKVTSKWKKAKGKNTGRANATTDVEQAEKEVLAKYKKQQESGYHLNPKDIDNETFFEPMLAESLEKFLKSGKRELVYPVFSQPKLDGIRAIFNNGKFNSRNGKPFVSVPHIVNDLTEVLDEEGISNIIFDGELYSHTFKDDFNEICSRVKKTKPTAEDLVVCEKIEYHVYDCFLVDNPDATFSERFAVLEKFLKAQHKKKRLQKIKLVRTTKVNSKKELDALYDDYLEKGYEGGMLRMDTPYENKRTYNLLKMKEFQDAEFTILGVIEGEGNRAGTVGKFIFRTRDDVEFHSNLKGKFEYITKLWENRDTLIGKSATVKYFRLTPAGVPRFPYVIKIDRESYE